MWVAGGLRERWVDEIEGTRAAAVRRQLLESGVDEDTVEKMMLASDLSDEEVQEIKGAPEVVEQAEAEAAAIALAMSESRQTISDLAGCSDRSNEDEVHGDVSRESRRRGHLPCRFGGDVSGVHRTVRIYTW